ncbi:MAG: hypothetical protein ACXW2A_15930 [Burkholderiales bacterium]
MRIVVFHAPFGGWAWERINERGDVVAESHYHFESREDCMEDALKSAPANDREQSPHELHALR